MPVPDYQNLMLPLLESIHDGKEHELPLIREFLAELFDLSIDDRAEKLPSGKQRKFDNRVGWARTYLKKAGLLETPGTGKVKITQRGLEVLAKKRTRIDRKFLMQFPEFVEFQKVEGKGFSEKDLFEKIQFGSDFTATSTPTEFLDAGYQGLWATG